MFLSRRRVVTGRFGWIVSRGDIPVTLWVGQVVETILGFALSSGRWRVFLLPPFCMFGAVYFLFCVAKFQHRWGDLCSVTCGVRFMGCIL